MTSELNQQDGVEASPGPHVVQLYTDDEQLCQVVSDFLLPAFSSGEAMLVVATRPHRLQLLQALRRRRLPTRRMLRSGQLRLLDARETLARISDGDALSPAKFIQVVGGSLHQMLARFSSRRVRVFGEMVDLLWTRGDEEASLALEAQWDRLAQSIPFSLLCAYRTDPQIGWSPFMRACRAHSHVLPGEGGLVPAPVAQRFRDLFVLEERVQVLERALGRSTACPSPSPASSRNPRASRPR